MNVLPASQRLQAIQSATSVAAEHMGWQEDVGALQPGRYADLVAVRNNPLADISVLENIDLVIKEGRTIAPGCADQSLEGCLVAQEH